MPPSKRRRTAASAATSKQQTLSFRSTKTGTHEAELPGKQAVTAGSTKSATKSAISKPQPEVDDLIAKNDPSAETQDANTAPRVEEETLTHADTVVKEEEYNTESEELKAKAAAEAELDGRALAISDTKIKSYWAAKQRERKAPRVHQEDLSVREKVLREFDMNSRYGPGIGITRVSRWRRAHKLGMNPPIEVLSVLLKEQREGGKGKMGAEKSIMDELIMSSSARGDAAIEA